MLNWNDSDWNVVYGEACWALVGRGTGGGGDRGRGYGQLVALEKMAWVGSFLGDARQHLCAQLSGKKRWI